MTAIAAAQHRDQTNLTEDFAHALAAHLNRLRAESHPHNPPVDPANVWGQMQHLPPVLELDFWTVEEAGQIVAHARTQLFNTGDNQHLAELELLVSPAARGRGLGRTLLGNVAQAMQARGRTLLITQTNDRVPAGDTFARRAGFQPGLSNHVNRLLLADIPDGLLEAWTTRPDDGYTLEVWAEGVPDADLNAYAELLNVMNSAPRDDLNVEDHDTTPQEVRSMERLARAGGRQVLTAVVRAPDGTLVGLTDLSWRPAQPGIVAQGNTGVRSEHRGHSLGRWLKAANIREMQRLNPHAAVLLLWHHALPIAVLLRLKWSAFTPEDGTLLRGDLITPLTPQTEAALTRLHQRAGYDPLYADTHGRTEHLRMFPYDTQDALRLRLRQVTRDADLPFTPPGLIRRAALRDHPGTPQTLGYTRDKDYRKALRHAQALADATRTP